MKGTRIPVHQVVHMLAGGDTIDDLLREYPSLSREDVLACLDYAADLAEEQLGPISPDLIRPWADASLRGPTRGGTGRVTDG